MTGDFWTLETAREVQENRDRFAPLAARGWTITRGDARGHRSIVELRDPNPAPGESRFCALGVAERREAERDQAGAPLTFTAWIGEQRQRPDRVGEFARFLAAMPPGPNPTSREDLADLVREGQWTRPLLTAATVAWREFRREQSGVPVAPTQRPPAVPLALVPRPRPELRLVPVRGGVLICFPGRPGGEGPGAA